MALLLVQALNGLQLGLLLFLIAAGLTLVFGVMDFVNLAHGAQYMLGAYFGAAAAAATGSFWLGLLAAAGGSLAIGLILELGIFRHLYRRDHLTQVLATFGVLLFIDESVSVIWGAAPLQMAMPDLLSGSVPLMPGLRYPVYRLFLIATGLVLAGGLALLVGGTRIGMRVRAGASNAAMVSALGVNVALLFTLVFGFGAMLAGVAGALVAPIVSVQPGMGDNFLILAFVVIVIGGIGSVGGAFLASLLVGLVDTLGRGLVSDLSHLVLSRSASATVGPALASMLIYLLMAAILAARPGGLFPSRRT